MRVLGRTFAIVVFAFVAQADPVLSIGVTITHTGPIFDYQYTVQNSLAASDAVVALILYSVTDVHPISETPMGWDGVFDPSSHTYTWIAEDQQHELQPGSSLSGFGISSTAAPGSTLFVGLGADTVSGFPVGSFDSGLTMGPSSVVPEPTSMSVLIGVLCAGVIARGIREHHRSRYSRQFSS